MPEGAEAVPIAPRATAGTTAAAGSTSNSQTSTAPIAPAMRARDRIASAAATRNGPPRIRTSAGRKNCAPITAPIQPRASIISGANPPTVAGLMRPVTSGPRRTPSNRYSAPETTTKRRASHSKAT